MYAMFGINIRHGDAEWTEILWTGTEKATEKELELKVIELLQTFYEDAETKDNWNPLRAVYSTMEMSYELDKLFYCTTKEEVSNRLLNYFEYSF